MWRFLGSSWVVLLLACNGTSDPGGTGVDESAGDAGVSPGPLAHGSGSNVAGGAGGGADDAATAKSGAFVFRRGAARPANIAIAAEGAITSIVASPGPLTPGFSPAIDDYYVRCSSGTC